MTKSIRDIPKKRGRPKTTGRGEGVLVRLHDPELSALDSWRSEQKPKPSRPEAIRFALRDWLIGMGAISIEKEPAKSGISSTLAKLFSSKKTGA